MADNISTNDLRFSCTSYSSLARTRSGASLCGEWVKSNVNSSATPAAKAPTSDAGGESQPRVLGIKFSSCIYQGHGKI